MSVRMQMIQTILEPFQAPRMIGGEGFLNLPKIIEKINGVELDLKNGAFPYVERVVIEEILYTQLKRIIFNDGESITYYSFIIYLNHMIEICDKTALRLLEEKVDEIDSLILGDV